MDPKHGWTKDNKPVHGKVTDHLPEHNGFAKFNKKLAIFITDKVGTMNCAYIFSILALCSLPAVLSAFYVFHGVFPDWLIKASLISLIAWIAQTYIQLVLLSVIMVGQNVQNQASDVRSTKTFEDTEKILDGMDLNTQGGLTTINEKLDTILNKLQ
jgi:hypothetical protein